MKIPYFYPLRGVIHLQGGSAHALIFSCALWSGIWPGIKARRLAGAIWDGLITKKSNFGGNKPPGRNVKASPLAWGR